MGFVGQVLIPNHQKFMTLKTVPEALRCVAVPARIKTHLLQAAFNTLNYKAEQLGLLYHIWPGVLGAEVGLGAVTCVFFFFLTSPLIFKYLSLLAQRSFHKQTKLSETDRGFVIFLHSCDFCLKKRA